ADGRRVADAIEQAGGLAEGADAGRLNLALRLQDGQQVVVPRVGEPTAVRSPARPLIASPPAAAAPRAQRTPRAGPAAPASDRPPNLNRARAAELEALPAIGRATAERIVRYREEHGPFGSPDDLRRAGLLSSAALERIRALVEAP